MILLISPLQFRKLLLEVHRNQCNNYRNHISIFMSTCTFKTLKSVMIFMVIWQNWQYYFKSSKLANKSINTFLWVYVKHFLGFPIKSGFILHLRAKLMCNFIFSFNIAVFSKKLHALLCCHARYTQIIKGKNNP